MKKKYTLLHCKLCDDVIVSKHRHDFVFCKCEGHGIDGGTDYIRITYTSPKTYETKTVSEKTLALGLPNLKKLFF